jgi:hypothetical protein
MAGGGGGGMGGGGRGDCTSPPTSKRPRMKSEKVTDMQRALAFNGRLQRRHDLHAQHG